jgi:hypothetical protein
MLREIVTYRKQTWLEYFLREEPDIKKLKDLLPVINEVMCELLRDRSFMFYTGWFQLEQFSFSFCFFFPLLILYQLRVPLVVLQ